jgi:hypothetical protein
MLSHGYITKSTVENLQTQKIRQEGPVCYTETTTKDSIFEEDVNRCFKISADDSEGQTVKVLDAIGESWLPGPDRSEQAQEQARKRHWGFQRALKRVVVRIPYAKALTAAMPKQHVKVRRIFRRHVIALIEVIAYLHQFIRPRNSFGQLEATLEDYALARRLVLGSLHLAIGLGKDFAKCQEIEKKLPQDKQFTTAEAAAALGKDGPLSRKVTGEALAKMATHGIIKLVRTGIGTKPSVWEWTGKTVDELLLPSVARVREAYVR